MDKEILAKIALFQKEFGGVKKNRSNDYTNSKFANRPKTKKAPGFYAYLLFAFQKNIIHLYPVNFSRSR